MSDLPEYKYTEGDMDTLRAVLRGCQGACQDLRNTLKKWWQWERNRNYGDEMPYELQDVIKQALGSPAQKEWERHEWVNKKRFDELQWSHDELQATADRRLEMLRMARSWIEELTDQLEGVDMPIELDNFRTSLEKELSDG